MLPNAGSFLLFLPVFHWTPNPSNPHSENEHGIEHRICQQSVQKDEFSLLRYRDSFLSFLQSLHPIPSLAILHFVHGQNTLLFQQYWLFNLILNASRRRELPVVPIVPLVLQLCHPLFCTWAE